MEPINLSPDHGLFLATDIIQTAKELQTNLATQPIDVQPELAEHAIDILGDPRELYSSKKMLIHALGAIVLTSNPFALYSDETIYHETYLGDAYIRTNFSRFSYVRHPIVQSICLQLAETNVLKSTSDPGLVGARIRSGVFVPVHSVESVFVA